MQLPKTLSSMVTARYRSTTAIILCYLVVFDSPYSTVLVSLSNVRKRSRAEHNPANSWPCILFDKCSGTHRVVSCPASRRLVSRYYMKHDTFGCVRQADKRVAKSDHYLDVRYSYHETREGSSAVVVVANARGSRMRTIRHAIAWASLDEDCLFRIQYVHNK